MKGMSPILATVLLLAFTVAIASIVSAFFLDTTREASAKVEEQAERTVDCGTASIRIDPESVLWNSTGSEIIFTVENNGQTDLEIPSALWYNSTGAFSTNITRKSDSGAINATNPLEAGKLLAVHINATSQPAKITISTNCPGKTSTVQNNTEENEWELVF